MRILILAFACYCVSMFCLLNTIRVEGSHAFNQAIKHKEIKKELIIRIDSLNSEIFILKMTIRQLEMKEKINQLKAKTKNDAKNQRR